MLGQPEAAEDFGPMRANELARIEGLIRDLDERHDTPEGFMRKHLTTARSCLLGALADEHRMTLELAKETLPLIGRPARRHRIDEFLRQQVKTAIPPG